MPAGLSGLLTGVELCGEAQADAGTCGPDSLIGETTVSVGLGGDPYSVTGGKVYITGPYEGAPFGVSVVVPAKAGPYDLGTVVVRGTIAGRSDHGGVDDHDQRSGAYEIPHDPRRYPATDQARELHDDKTGVHVQPDQLRPDERDRQHQQRRRSHSTAIGPVPSHQLRDRSPSNRGSRSQRQGKPSRANGASLNVKLTYPKAVFGSQANIKSVKVDLPKQLPSRLTTLQKACTAAQFQANPAGCPAASIVGHATAITPIDPSPADRSRVLRRPTAARSSPNSWSCCRATV